MELLHETQWTVAMTWTRAGLAKNAFVATVAEVGTMRPVASIGVEELDERWYGEVLLF